MHPIDWAILAAFFVAQLWLGFHRTSGRFRSPDAADYLLGGRRLTIPVFVATLVSTWYGGVLGVGEYSFKYGISNWLVFGVPYYLWAAVFAVYLARPARRTLFISLPDHLGQAYGRKPALIGSLVVFILALPAAYALMIGDLARLLLGWPLWYGIALAASVSVLNLFLGGFRASVRIDVLQFLCMFLGFALILPFAFWQHGGWTYITHNLPATHLTWHGGNSGWYVFSWYFIATSTLVDPAFYQRCYATHTESVARWGIVWSILFWVIFDFMTTTAGLYARAALPTLTDAQNAYPALAAKVLPPGVMGLFMVGVVATIVSSLDSYMFISGIALGRDLLSRLRPMSDRAVRAATRWGIVVSAALSIVLALALHSVIAIWRDLGSIGVPMILLPVLATFRRRPRKLRALAVTTWMALPGIASATWIILRETAGGYPWGLEPIFPGLAISVAVGAVLLIRERSETV